VVGQPQATQRYPEWVPKDEPALVQRMRELSAAEPRLGYSRIAALLRKAGE
jgi:hypothetical protein